MRLDVSSCCSYLAALVHELLLLLDDLHTRLDEADSAGAHFRFLT
jgi:hypothetical protein